MLRDYSHLTICTMEDLFLADVDTDSTKSFSHECCRTAVAFGRVASLLFGKEKIASHCVIDSVFVYSSSVVAVWVECEAVEQR